MKTFTKFGEWSFLRKINNFLIFSLLISLNACAAGSKRPDFSKYPQKNIENTIWDFCEENEFELCEYDCEKWIKKGTICKDQKLIIVRKIHIKQAKELGMVILDREMFLNMTADEY